MNTENKTETNDTIERNQDGNGAGVASTQARSVPPLASEPTNSTKELVQESIYPTLAPPHSSDLATEALVKEETRPSEAVASSTLTASTVMLGTSDLEPAAEFSSSSCTSDQVDSALEPEAAVIPSGNPGPGQQDTVAPVPEGIPDEPQSDTSPLEDSGACPPCSRRRRVASPFIKGRVCRHPVTKTVRSRPRLGKVANLPDDLREWVSQQILDEVPYDEIIETLIAEGHGDINQQNITNWKTGGHLEWLKEHNARAERATHLQVITDYVSQNRGSVEEAALLVVANQLLDIVGDFDVTLMKEELTNDPQAYIKVIQALTRLKQVRQASGKNGQSRLDIKPSHQDAEGLLPNAERGLTEETLKKITDAIRLF